MALKDKKWFQAIVKFAPMVAESLGGPLAGLGMSAIKEALNLPADSTEKDIEKAIERATPADFIRLKEANNKFLATMKELDIKADQLAYEDIDSARSRQMAMKDNTPAILTGVALTFFFALSASVLYNLDIVQENQAFVMFLFGAASGWVTQGMSYFLGSSKGSQRKTDILANGKP